MTCEFSGKESARRYRRDMAIAAVLYAATVFGAAYALRYLDLPQWAAIPLSLVPIAPALLMLRAYLVFHNSMDEFQRRVQSEALIIASAVTVFSSFAYGFLEEWADFPHIPLIWVLPAFCAVFGVAAFLVKGRYK